MAVYKVPQDVEAEDKLIGPFSFRQFIYLIIVAVGIAVAWFLGQIFLGLILIPMPFIIFFGALALPLRKDQPMEIYLAAVVRFFIKPRLRLWQPEGQINLVTIIAPHSKEEVPTKSLTVDEARARLSYLSNVIDTQGWAARGVNVTDTSLASLNDTVTAEASTIDDMLDDTIGIGRQFTSLIEEQDAIRKRQVAQNFQTALQQPQTAPQLDIPMPSQQIPLTSSANTTQPQPQPSTTGQYPNIDYNPYPSMRQSVIAPSPPASARPRQPAAQLAPAAPQQYTPQPAPVLPAAPQPQASPHPEYQPPTQQNASGNTPSPDIMRLANSNTLSISGLAHEAHRLEEKDDEEVIVSLR